MLVLSRKKQESIRIGDDIEVIVLEVGKNRVRLGFRCPPHVSISREELCQFETQPNGKLQSLPEEVELACV